MLAVIKSEGNVAYNSVSVQNSIKNNISVVSVSAITKKTFHLFTDPSVVFSFLTHVCHLLPDKQAKTGKAILNPFCDSQLVLAARF